MSERILTDFDRQCVAAYEAYVAAGSLEAAYRQSGVPRHTFSNRLLQFFLRDLGGDLPIDITPGFQVSRRSITTDGDGNLVSQSIQTKPSVSDEPFEVPDGHRVKGESALVDAAGRVLQRWVKTSEGERSLDQIAEAARLAAERYTSPAPISCLSEGVKERLDPKLLNIHLLPDLHIGMNAHFRHAQMDWNLETAIRTYRRLMRLLVERSPFAEEAVILGGGDLLHFDDPTKMTRRSGAPLDADQPYSEVLAATEDLLVYQTDLALMKHKRVIVRILPGNHDPDSAIAIAHYLKAWFRNDPRVVVDIDPGLFWFHQFGSNMFGATHGHETKIHEMPGIMAADRPKMWGDTETRYAFGFHIHHKTKGTDEKDGACWETFETPCPRDLYHQSLRYRAGRSLPVLTFHKDKGETGRTLEGIVG